MNYSSVLQRPRLDVIFLVLFLFSLLALSVCKSPTGTDPPPSNIFYNITTVTIDIFKGSEASGVVILNGERKDSGGTFRIENGNIESISVEVPGFIPDYIFCQSEAGETLLTRDASGLNCPALTTDITLYLKLIPSDFNVTMLAKCLGGGTKTMATRTF